MNRSRSLFCLLLCLGLALTLVSSDVHAQPQVGEPEVPLEKLERRKFSAGRFVLESLVGAAVGSGAALGLYFATCGDEPCIGGAIGGLAANVAVTPLAVFGVGRLAGGDGTLGRAYFGGIMGLGVGASVSSIDPMLALAIGTTLMPFFSAAVFELSSHGRAKEALIKRGAITPVAHLLPGRDGISGMSIGLSGRL